MKIEWYLIDTERHFCKIWNFLITLLILYSLIMTPLILVFPDIYATCDGTWYENSKEVY